jgi:DNA-binding NarL/FixJ family response regulator
VNVFLVENSPRIVELLTRLLEEEGIAIAGSSGKAGEALAAIRTNPPTAAIVDILLDQGSGYEFLAELRNVAPATRAFVLSSFDTTQYREAAGLLGVRPEDFYSKGDGILRLIAALKGLQNVRPDCG